MDEEPGWFSRWLFGIAQYFLGSPGKVLLWGVSLLAISILLPVDLGDSYSIFVKNFVHELGFSFLIGCVIAFGIEQVAKEKQNALVKTQMEMLNKNVIEAVYHRRFPESIFKHIEASVLQQTLLRSDVDVTFYFERVDPPDTRIVDTSVVILRVAAQARILNTGPTVVQYEQGLFIEKPWDAALRRYCAVNRVSIGGKVLTIEELAEADRRAPDTKDFILFQFDGIDVQPGLDGGILTEIEYQFAKYGRDSATWRTVLPCSNARVTIVHPAELELCVDAIHLNDLISYGPTESPGMRQYRFDGPLLPQNGLELWWRTRPASAAKPASVTKEVTTRQTKQRRK